jgi:hypothetical protein
MKYAADGSDWFFTTDQGEGLPMPRGDTDLSTAVLEAYKTGPDLVLLVTDGYENVSAGTLDSVIHALNRVGVQAPLIQLNPVLGAEVGESGGIRRVSEKVFASAAKGPESIGHLYEKMAIAYAGQDARFIPALKQYLLARLGPVEVPESIRLQFEHVESLPVGRLDRVLAAGPESPELAGVPD